MWRCWYWQVLIPVCCFRRPQYLDVELESLIALELVSLHATNLMRQNEPGDEAPKSMRQKA